MILEIFYFKIFSSYNYLGLNSDLGSGILGPWSEDLKPRILFLFLILSILVILYQEY